MTMKKLFALALCLCMVLSLIPATTFAQENDTLEEEITLEQTDSGKYQDALELGKNTLTDLELEKQMVDEDGMIHVFIVMESEAILEADAAAGLDDESIAKITELEQEQAEVISRIEDEILDGETLDVSQSYTWLFNGIAAKIPYSAKADIAALEGVKQVVVEPVYELHDAQSQDGAQTFTVGDGGMIGREDTWAQGYTGKGMKIAIIDTGLDLDHQNFQPLSQDKLTKDSADVDTIADVLDGLNAYNRMDGKVTAEELYQNTKVAFAFNYADDRLDATHDYDSQGDHGTHVSGIAAANKVDGSDVVGVAPDAQLYVMKVFGYARAGQTSDILAALEDALMLEADVVNMSLGTNAGFTTSSNEFVNEIYDRVAQTGTVLAVSAGNNYTAGILNNWGTNLNLTKNPDNGVVGQPGVYHNVLSVASVENAMVMSNYILFGAQKLSFNETSDSYGMPLITTLTDTYEIVAIPGFGREADYKGLDLTGKVALVSRGGGEDCTFPVKVENAENAGAVACIVYNNEAGYIGMNLNGCKAKIPAVSISQADGEMIKATLEKEPATKISFPKDTMLQPSDLAYQMSEFTSWGAAPDLSLEPDLTAPGGNIYSTTNNGTYGVMSGTSMASPNVAGISALVMQYVRENFSKGTDYRTLVRQLLMSTSQPLVYGDGLFYSPRQQGSGLANANLAVSTKTYLTVDGCDVPKAELGADPSRTGAYSYEFAIHNFGTTTAFYRLDTVAQSEGVAVYADEYFMSGTPVALDASVRHAAEGMLLLHDVDDSGVTNAHDAYQILQASKNGSWKDAAARYDVDGNATVDADDVQAYLEALVGNDSQADLDAQALAVAPGADAQVSVTVTLSQSDKDYLDTYYTNGGYVEGFTFLTALSEDTADLSLPYMAFYGNWGDAEQYDSAWYWDVLEGGEDEVLFSQYYHALWSNLQNADLEALPGVNVYSNYGVEEAFDVNHISLSPNGDGSYDAIQDVYISLLRNARTLTIRFVDAETGENYGEETLQDVAKSIYSSGNGSIVPFVMSWYLDAWEGTDAEGNVLPNNTKVLMQIEATGAYEGATATSMEVPITIDLEAPQVTAAKKVIDLNTGKTTLELTFRDNLACSMIGLLTSSGKVIEIQGVADVEADENGYQNYTASFDITDVTGKVVLMVDDYAMNTASFTFNMGGEGAPYGDLIGYGNDPFTGSDAWISFSEGVDQDEVVMFGSSMDIVAAEYVGGYIFAQADGGALYGFRYEDMLKDSFTLEAYYIAQLDNVYQDFAYNYVDGQLYGLTTYTDRYGAPNTEVFSINLRGEYSLNEWQTVGAYEETSVVSRSGLTALTMASDDAGSLYLLGQYSEYDWDAEIYIPDETASLWVVPMEENEWTHQYQLSWSMVKVGMIDQTMDFLQSMTWDHNTEKLYWARCDADGWDLISELYTIDPQDTREETVAGAEGEAETTVTYVNTTKVGTLSYEVSGLMAPLDAKAAQRDPHTNIPDMNAEEKGKPVLRDDVLTMNVTGSKQLAYDVTPWYTNYKTMTWSSSDETVVSVDEEGVIHCLKEGSATITVANAADESLFDTVQVEVTALDLSLDGFFTEQPFGTGATGDVYMYNFTMNKGVDTFTQGNQITASNELNFGMDLTTSVAGRGYLWTCEYGNAGMIYKIDPATGKVVEALQPYDGDHLYGMSYSQSQDTFSAIMNMYLYVDMELTEEETNRIINTWNEDMKEYTYHKLDMLPYLLAAGENFVTGENGQGASSEIVFCGITTQEYDSTHTAPYVEMMTDFLGNYSDNGESAMYTPTQTLILLDNVGRLWYVDEIKGLSYYEDDYGNQAYVDDSFSTIIFKGLNGVEAIEDLNGTYSVFVVREIEETPLTAMFNEGSLPRITYHFSDIELAGYTEDGAVMIAMSLYDYWNNGITNELYLYVAGAGTGEYTYDENWNMVEIKTPDRLYKLGTTGDHRIIASIHAAEVTGGVDHAQTEEERMEELGVTPLGVKPFLAD